MELEKQKMINVDKALNLSRVDWEKSKITSLEHQFSAISNLIDDIRSAKSENIKPDRENKSLVTSGRNDKHKRESQENDFLFIAPKNKNRTYLVPNIL